ncbi:MAG: hypothetical protein RDU14_13245 [Melioribacteraceae bacterium]|nr:hypothetical protein [Melioribacteraceae bacterium]
MKNLFVITFILIASITTFAQYKTEPVQLNKGPQLFIDDYLIAEQSFLTRTVNNPKKMDKPILYGGQSKDQVWQPYFSVIQDPETKRFKMWYNTFVESMNISRCKLSYIESDDGINWHRPFHVCDYPEEIQFGCTVLDRGQDFINPQERYLFATYLKPGFRIATSPDGINWKPISKDPVFLHNHDITTLHWDPIRKHYLAVVSHRLPGFSDPNNPKMDEQRRIPHQTVSKDLINWEPIKPIFWPKVGAPIEKGETQFYAMSGVIARGGLLIGLVKILRDDINATAGASAYEMADMDRKAAGLGYTVLAWSRDGYTWQRDYEPFIPNNPVPGSWDHAMAWGDEQVIVGNETFLYYGGYQRGHKVNRFEERHLCLARMPVDRYVSRDADLNTGYLITKPVLFNSEQLSVNANIKGEMRVRLLDSERNPLNDFGWVELKGDSINHEVKWKGKLSSLSGKTVCLEFQFKHAQLFSFNLN